ncbi:bifunctional diguanylate cyclase/phosphodiesterase [Nitrogeniibacter aestuarii]|uniref:bifunctional diguanylate cyclase/phosphodiesterase n=1 Tax=Nitrogeniibacter aestuarii TaxID=2815343 RepID=UPI002AB1F790|nr:EAL domain-containing protein [Nitrogeniibacter aestuarii]
MRQPPESPPRAAWQTDSTTGIERWLPRVILGGMMTLVLSLVIGMGAYYVYRHQQATSDQIREIAERAIANRERLLAGEIDYLSQELKTHRARFATDLQDALRQRTDEQHDLISALYHAVQGEIAPAQIETFILEAIRPLRNLDGAGAGFVIGQDGTALHFPLAPQLEGQHLTGLRDDTGLAFADEFRRIAADENAAHSVRFRWHPRGENEAMADAVAYVRIVEPLGWTIGNSEFVHAAYASLRTRMLEQLSARANNKAASGSSVDSDVLMVLDRDSHLIAAPAPLMRAALAENSHPLLRNVSRFADASLRGGGVVKFEVPPTSAQPSRRYLAYASMPDEWGWTLVSISPLDQIDALVAEERQSISTATANDFRLTALIMLAVTTIAILLSVLFYRWIEARFQHYHTDIASRNRALSENAQELRLSAQVFEASKEAIAILDHRFRIVSVNPALERISGFTRSGLIGRHCADLLTDGFTDSRIWLTTAAEIQREGHWTGELELVRPSGSAYPAWVSVGEVTNDAGHATHFVVSISDISDQKRTEQRLRHLAEYDALTSLPNRVLLLDRMANAILSARRHGHHLAVLFIDLDRFKNINDSLGHAVGDELLRQVAHRLSGIVRGSDTVSRLGGDEFVVLLTELDTPGRAATIASKMISSLAAPFYLDGHELTITPSIGITVFPEDGDNRDILLKNADAAMYHAKENGRNGYQFFTSELNERAQLRLELENDLRRALSRHEFALAFQPQFDLRSGQLVGAEALVRWHHPERGMIPPDQFIPIAEETGLIVPLGAWILRQACANGQKWRDEGLPDITIAVNVSAMQVRRGQFDAVVLEALSETGFPPDLLELEVTESALMTNQDHVSSTLKAVQSLGVKLAIDDFGTGYSSLGYLKRFSLDKLKIDRSFIDDLPDDKEDAHLTRAIIGIGHNLDMKVIAEGVETEAQEAFLSELGCDLAQGYLYARPLSRTDFRQMQIDLHYQATSKPASSTA